MRLDFFASGEMLVQVQERGGVEEQSIEIKCCIKETFLYNIKKEGCGQILFSRANILSNRKPWGGARQ